MTRLKNLILTIFISPEFLTLLILCGGYTFNPEIFDTVGKALIADDTIWKWLPTLPLLFSGLAFKLSLKLKTPLSGSNKDLYDWPHYKLLKDRIHVCLVIAVITGGAAIYIWIFGKSLSYTIVGVTFLAATIISSITSLTMFVALPDLIEILDKYKAEPD